jgi:hypothetical protein
MKDRLEVVGRGIRQTTEHSITLYPKVLTEVKITSYMKTQGMKHNTIRVISIKCLKFFLRNYSLYLLLITA